jgi:hypothetical protein
MLDIQQFKKIAVLERHEPIVAQMDKLPPPHDYALEVIQNLAGIQLMPFDADSNTKFDVCFGVEEAAGYQQLKRCQAFS